LWLTGTVSNRTNLPSVPHNFILIALVAPGNRAAVLQVSIRDSESASLSSAHVLITVTSVARNIGATMCHYPQGIEFVDTERYWTNVQGLTDERDDPPPCGL
jgi:hypothetical protein